MRCIFSCCAGEKSDVRFSIPPLSFISCPMCVFTEDDQLSEPDYVSQEECETRLFVLFDASKQLFGSPNRTMNCMRIRTRSMTTAMSLPPATGSSPQPHPLPLPGGSIWVNNVVASTTMTTHHFNSHSFFSQSSWAVLHLVLHCCLALVYIQLFIFIKRHFMIFIL